MSQCRVIDGVVAEPRLFRVLMMGKDDPGISIWEDGLRLHGCLVQVCRTYLEFMLFLEHEPFNLIVIFEGLANQLESQAAFSYLNEFQKATPLIVVNRPDYGGWLSPNVECPN